MTMQNLEDISLQRRELALRKEDATGKSAQEEILQRKKGGMLNKIALGITDLGKDFKAKEQMLVKVFSKAHFLLVCFSQSELFQSPLFGKMIDFITGTLIPKLQVFL